MIWLGLLAIACGLWFTKQKVATVIIFFFFLTNGFQLIPALWFDTGMGIQKGADFALIILMTAFTGSLMDNVKMLRTDPIARAIMVFIGFVFISIIYSKFVLQYDMMVILRVARRFLFLLGYFVFKQLSYKEVEKIIHIMVGITFVQCLIFLAQIYFGVTLLNRQSDEVVELSGRGAIGEWKRLYNLPEYTVFCMLYLMFTDKIRTFIRVSFVSIMSIAFVMTLHRSWITWFIVVIGFVGLFRTSGLWKKILTVTTISAFALLPILLPAVGERLESGLDDIKNAMSGGFNANTNKFEDSFSFRIAHVLERWDFITREPAGVIFGVGFLTEDANQSQYLNFSVGWADKYGTRQIDTADISWSLMFMWCGVVGSVLYLVYYFRNTFYLWKHRESNIAVVGVSYMLLYFLTSFTSTTFIEATSIIVYCMITAATTIELTEKSKQYTQEIDTILTNNGLYQRRLQFR